MKNPFSFIVKNFSDGKLFAESAKQSAMLKKYKGFLEDKEKLEYEIKQVERYLDAIENERKDRKNNS